MNRNVIITCAVTGSGDTASKHPDLPITPKQIAEAAIEAAKAGAAVAHIHVRAPKTGKGNRDPKLFREVVERIRNNNTDVIVNLTSGMGGDLDIGPGEKPKNFGRGTGNKFKFSRMPREIYFLKRGKAILKNLRKN